MDKRVLYDQKRLKLLRRAWLFNLVPFISKVYVAGSLALGNVRENSDFDVVVVTESGRLYTCRFFCLLLFGIAGWRRTLQNARDGFCFNHFTTSLSINVNFPHFDGRQNEGMGLYAKQLYQNLIEIPMRRTCSISLMGRLEPFFKWLQIYRVKKFLKKFPPTPNSRIIYNDERVELCFNLKELERTVKKL